MSSPIRFDGEVAIVTGAGNGLGRAYAIELASRGAAVVCNDILEDAADATVEAIVRDGGSAVADSHSVATSAGGAAVVQTAFDTFGHVEVVINNAGQLRNASFADMTVDDFHDVLSTHLSGAFHVTQPAYRYMIEAGYGRVVFTSSAAGMFGSPWHANYGAAKAGLVGLCNVVALEGAQHGITANVIMPMALTSIGRDAPPAFAPEQLKATVRALKPLMPYLTVDNVTPLVVCLASRGCECTGRIFSVGAGHVAEVFIAATRGWYAPDLAGMTAEQVASSLRDASDRSEYAVPQSMNEEADFIAAHLARDAAHRVTREES